MFVQKLTLVVELWKLLSSNIGIHPTWKYLYTSFVCITGF